MARIPIKQYHKIWRKRATALKPTVNKTRVATAKYVTALIRSKAPRKNGRLLSGIRRRGTIIEVRATGDNGFPYVKWINGNIDTIVIRRSLATGNFLPKSTPLPHNTIYARYGLQPSSWKWSGKRAFVRTSPREGRKFHKELMVRNLRKSLEVSV